jgi:repressor LexA
MNLTPKQLRIVQLVRDSRIRHGYSPTMQEIADTIGISKVTAFEHVETLVKRGALHRERNRARSLTIPKGVPLPDEEQPLRFPLVGTIAAGLPIEKMQTDDELDIGSLLGPRPGISNGSFALQVEGESMKDEGILEGDYIIVERTEVARNGDRVIALLPDGSTTLKTFYKEKDHFRLQPANDDFEPIRVKNVKIQGIVRGVLRRY